MEDINSLTETNRLSSPTIFSKEEEAEILGQPEGIKDTKETRPCTYSSIEANLNVNRV